MHITNAIKGLVQLITPDLSEAEIEETELEESKAKLKTDVEVPIKANTTDFDSKEAEVTKKLNTIKLGAQAAITADTETALSKL
jgi:hypothetical protein